MAVQPIFVGQRIPVEGAFRLRGVPRDPMVVRCLIKPPSGGLVSLVYPNESLRRLDTGLYEAAVAVTEPGTWYFRWEGAGTVDAVTEIPVEVRPSVVSQSVIQ